MTTRCTTCSFPLATFSGLLSSLPRWLGAAVVAGRWRADPDRRGAAGTTSLLSTVACTLVAILGSWVGGVRPAEAACAPTSLQVSAQVMLLPSEVIPVAWSIDPACAVVETGLLLGTEPNALAPVGQPIYGQRERYEQAIPVAASGRYWVAAYARDEAGEFVQSPPRVVFVTVPLPPADDPHGSHGPLPFYTGTNADFLQPAGEPHFASLRGASVTSQFAGSGSVFWRGWSAGEERGISSTDRNEVLARQARPFLAGGVSVPVKATDVGTSLNRIDNAFRLF